MTVEVEAAEVTVPALLESIERGDLVQLKKNGRTIAIVSPTVTEQDFPKRTPEQIAEARAALAGIDELSKRLGLKFDFEEFKADRDFGRR